MPKFFLIISFCSLLLFGCSASTEDCICTMEFRTISVNVVDQNNNHVELDSVSIVNKRSGKIYEFSGEVFPGAQGVYTVMNDEYVKDISTGGDEISFKGFTSNSSVESYFIISTDECKCHIHKTAGPDTLTINI